MYPFTDNEEKTTSVSHIIFFFLRLVYKKCKENLQKKCSGAFTVERFSKSCFRLKMNLYQSILENKKEKSFMDPVLTCY